MPKLPISRRTAVLGGVAVTGAAALAVGMAAPALAADSQLTSCTDQVRVRSAPKADAPVIGSCAAHEKVTVDETRNGFAHVVNKRGWVSSEYIASPTRSSGGSSSHEPSSSDNDNDASSSDNGDRTDSGSRTDSTSGTGSNASNRGGSNTSDRTDNADNSDNSGHHSDANDSGDSDDSGGLLGF